MTTRIVFTRSADADAAGIFEDLTATAGLGTALAYQTKFTRLYGILAAHPKSGPLRDTIAAGVRIGIVLPYLVIYKHDEARRTITVLRIVHGRRRISGVLLRER